MLVAEKVKKYLSKKELSFAFIEISRRLSVNTELNTIKKFDFTSEELRLNLEKMAAWNVAKNRQISSITWVIPSFTQPFAGIANILSMANFFSQKNIIQQFVLIGDTLESKICDINIKQGAYGKNLANARILINPNIDEIPYSDISIATSWNTAFTILKFNNTKGKYYLIQDDERLFYPANTYFNLAGLTYYFGFIGITNSLELKKMYETEFNGKAIFYFPLPKKDFFNPQKRANKKIKRVWFYARPRSDRNGFNLGMLALQEIKHRHPEIQIYMNGEKAKKVKLFEFNDQGIIRTTAELAKNFATYDVGLYILFSKHTGVIPFELMASKVVTLTNKRAYETKLLVDGYNCIMGESTPSSLADAFDRIYYNMELYKKILDNGYNTTKHTTQQKEFKKVLNFIIGRNED